MIKIIADSTCDLSDEILNEYNISTVPLNIMIDEKSMSHGSGYLILKSALLREKGATYSELIDFNETYKTNVKHLSLIHI